MFESMWSSMTSSMQLAAECLKQESETASVPQPVEGLELFAQTIDSSELDSSLYICLSRFLLYVSFFSIVPR